MSDLKRSRPKWDWEFLAVCLGLLSMVVAGVGLWVIENRSQVDEQPDWHLVSTYIVWMDPSGDCLGATHGYTCDDPPPGPYNVGLRVPTGSGGWTVSFVPGSHWSSEAD